MADLKQFYAKRESKFKEICELVATQLGFDPTSLTNDQRYQVGEEAEQFIDDWHEGPELKSQIPANPTPLQHLLIEYCHIEDNIILLEDELPRRI